MSLVSHYRPLVQHSGLLAARTRVRSSLVRLFSLAAMPVLFWLVGSLFFGGNIGLNSDDYALNLRDPVTGAVPAGVSTLVPYGYFFRPLHLALTFSIGTYLPDAHRALHIASALAHGLVFLGVLMFARRASVRLVGPLCGAIVFLTLPLNAEVILWFSTISTSLSVLVFFWLAHLVVRFAECEDERLAVRGPVLIAAAAFIVACLFEQPLAGTAGLPLLCFATRAGPAQIRVRAGRAVQVAFACAASGLAYSTLLLWTAPPGARGGSGSFVPVHRVGERFWDVASQVGSALAGNRAHDMLLGSLSNARELVFSPVGVVLCALVIATCATLVHALCRSRAPESDPPADTASRLRPWWTIAAMLVSTIAAWLPVYLIDHQIVQDRTFYFPAATACIALAILLDRAVAVIRSENRRMHLTATCVVATTALAAVGATSQVGWQRAFRDRSHADGSILDQLARMVPNPPPGALFVPMRLDDRAASTAVPQFNDSLVGVMHTHWAATDSLRRLYRRDDIGAMGATRWLCPPFVGATSSTTGISLQHTRSWTRLSPRDRYPWSSIIPFQVSDAGRVSVARAIIIEQPDGSDLRVPILASRDSSTNGPRFLARTWDDTPPHGSRQLSSWKWTKDSSPVSFENIEIWSGRRTCTWIHPAGSDLLRREMSTALPPSERARTVVFRATIAENDLARFKPRSSVILILEAGVTHPVELARFEVLPDEAARRRGWFPIVAQLPPTARLTNLTLRVEPGNPAPGESQAALSMLPPIMITPGLILPPPPEHASAR